MGTPFMTTAEIHFLAKNLKPRDRVWEWGSGASTLWLSRRVARVFTVDHQRFFAAKAIEVSLQNTQVTYAPPDFPFDEGAGDDGDHETFRRYVECYTGRNVDVVILDGRARIACARQVAECAAFGPFPGMRIFLHDAGREEYRRIWEDDLGKWGRGYFRKVEQVEELIMMEPRL